MIAMNHDFPIYVIMFDNFFLPSYTSNESNVVEKSVFIANRDILRVDENIVKANISQLPLSHRNLEYFSLFT